jgi:hypothetical protein
MTGLQVFQPRILTTLLYAPKTVSSIITRTATGTYPMLLLMIDVFSIDFKSRYYGRIASGKMGIMLIENGSWSSEFNDGHFMFNHVSFPQPETGFATANTDDNDGISWLSRVYMYSNGQWDQILQLGENRHPITALYAIDENNAWIASRYCTILFHL